MSQAVVERLQQCGPEVDAADREEPDSWGGEEHRYCSVSE